MVLSPGSTGGFSTGTLVSPHNKATEMPQYVPLRDIFSHMLELVFQLL